MLAVANAGMRAIVPDMPGFAGTESLNQCSDYNIARISDFLLGLIAHYGAAPVKLVGHDWGANNAWFFTLRHPESVSQLVTMSVPLRRHTDKPPMEIYRKNFGDKFFYQLYFQDPDLAEQEFDANPRAILSRLLCSPDTPRDKPTLSNNTIEGGGWIDRLGAPLAQPDWLSNADLDYFVQQYQHSGFKGGICYYRNIDRNWELMAPYKDQAIECPVMFIAGSADIVLRGADQQQLEQWMSDRVPNLSIQLLPNYGHWIQQEAADRVNQLLVSFLK